MRGFTREILSLLAWAGAAAAAYALFPLLRPVGNMYISPGWLADGASAMGIFLPSLLLLWMLSSNLSHRVKTSAIGALDRTLGFVFGLGRGVVLVAILFLGLGWLIPMEPEPPAWVAGARTLPLVKYCADLFLNIQQVQPPASAEIIPQPAKAADSEKHSPDSPAETGYKSRQRQSLEQLIEGRDVSP